MSAITCAGVAAGVPVLACISAAADYWPGYFLLLLVTGIIYFRLDGAPARERFTAVLITLTIITFLGTIRNMLFPDHFFIITGVLFIGSVVLLAIRN